MKFYIKYEKLAQYIQWTDNWQYTTLRYVYVCVIPRLTLDMLQRL